MYIKIGRVKFGDCFVIVSGKDKLIIDCGSSNKGNNLKKGEFAYNQLENLIDLRDENLNLMISHFDEDHYNGILEINSQSIFNKIYIPNYLYENKEVIEVIAYIILLAKNRTKASNGSKSLIKLFTEKLEYLRKNQGEVILVEADENICLGKDKFIALWPEKNYKTTLDYNSDFWKKNFTLLLKIINKTSLSSETYPLINEYFFSEHLENEKIDKLINNFSEQFYKLMLAFKENTKEQIEKFTRELQSTSEILINLNNEINLLYNMYKKNLDNHFEYKQEKKTYYTLQSNIKLGYNYLMKDMNSCSIIIHKPDDVLFLGDAPSYIIDNLKTNSFLQAKYKVIKAQHHATKKHYSKSIPKSDLLLIPNGGYKSRKIHKNFINNTDFVFCTNGWQNPDYCEFFSEYGYCSSKCIFSIFEPPYVIL